MDIPLLIENKLNKNKDILVFVESKNPKFNLYLKKEKNYNKKVIEYLRKLQKTVITKKVIQLYN